MPQSEIEVAPAGPEDVDLIAPLFDAYRQFYQQPADLPAARAFLSQRLERQESVILLATINREPVGFTQLYPSFSSVRMQPLWILNDLFVTPVHRRSGAARALLTAAADFARARHACRLVLATAKDNHPAQSLYRECGWKLDTTFDHFEFGLG